LTRIFQGKQSDPKESNALLNPILERPPEAESEFTRLARSGDAPPLREESKEKGIRGAIQGGETVIKEKSIIKREEPEVKREEIELADGYGMNSVKIHDSNSYSSKDREKQPSAKQVTRKLTS